MQQMDFNQTRVHNLILTMTRSGFLFRMNGQTGKRSIGIRHGFDLSGHLHTCLSPVYVYVTGGKKMINTADRWFQRFSLSSAPFTTDCHSPLAAQAHLTPAGDSYSLSGFQLSVGSRALPVVHFKDSRQEAMVSFQVWAEYRSSGSRVKQRHGP